MSADHIAALEAALQAGPTDGPWAHETLGAPRPDVRAASGRAVACTWMVCSSTPKTAAGYQARAEEDRANAAYIAAANPAAIRALLAELRALREELAAEQARADMHADLGRRTAEALGLKPEEGRAHMPEVAARMSEQNASLAKCLFQMQEAAKDLARQLDGLRAENEALKRPPTDAQIVELAAAAGIEQQVRHSGGTYVLPTPVLRRFVEMVLAAQAAKERT